MIVLLIVLYWFDQQVYSRCQVFLVGRLWRMAVRNNLCVHRWEMTWHLKLQCNSSSSLIVCSFLNRLSVWTLELYGVLQLVSIQQICKIIHRLGIPYFITGIFLLFTHKRVKWSEVLD